MGGFFLGNRCQSREPARARTDGQTTTRERDERRWRVDTLRGYSRSKNAERTPGTYGRTDVGRRVIGNSAVKVGPFSVEESRTRREDGSERATVTRRDARV